MSELGDKERRFVEDQRVVEARSRVSDRWSAPSRGSDPNKVRDALWHEYLLEFAANHGMKSIDSSHPLAYIDRKIARQDTLLAEAAEVLASFPTYHRTPEIHSISTITNWWTNRAKPLLDKLGGAEVNLPDTIAQRILHGEALPVNRSRTTAPTEDIPTPNKSKRWWLNSINSTVVTVFLVVLAIVLAVVLVTEGVL